MIDYEGSLEKDILSSQRAQYMNGRLYSSCLLREAKRILEKQRKERALLIKELKERQKS